MHTSLELSGVSEQVFAVLFGYRLEGKPVYLSITNLCDAVGASRSAVIRALNDLKIKGYLETIHSSGRRNSYRININEDIILGALGLDALLKWRKNVIVEDTLSMNHIERNLKKNAGCTSSQIAITNKYSPEPKRQDLASQDSPSETNNDTGPKMTPVPK